MKIAVLGTRGFPNVQGGVETHCEELYPRLVKLGCEVTVLARQPYVGTEDYSYKGVTIKPLPCVKNKFLETIMHTWRGVRAARNMNLDILHIHAIGPSLFVPLARMMGLKVVMAHHGPDYKRKKWGRIIKSILRIGESAGCRNADAIIAISDEIGSECRSKFKREIDVIPNGVAVPQIARTEGALKRFGLERGQYVLAVGRFVPEKGFHDLIEAFKLVSHGAWKLAIVGSADHEDKYSRMLKSIAANNPDIVLTGFLSGQPLREIYSHAGLFVLPSSYEGLPIALLEAMSYGLSCVVSDIQANRGFGLDESRYFKPGDIYELAGKILRFMVNPFSEEKKAEQIDSIAKNYDWDVIAEKTLAVYQKIGDRSTYTASSRKKGRSVPLSNYSPVGALSP